MSASSKQIATSIVAHGLGVTGCELPKVSKGMQELHDIQVERLKKELAEVKFHLALVRGLARDKDRERRKHISTLYLALAFSAGFVAYLWLRG